MTLSPILSQHRRPHGMTLIELLVGMALALVAALIVVEMFANAGGLRRATAGANDATQTATLSVYYLNKLAQQAGAGLARADHVWGCRLLATRSATALLPRASAYPYPFSAVPQTVRVAPAILVAGDASSSDVLISMAANSYVTNRNIGVDINTSGTTNQLNPGLPPLGVSANDLILAVPYEVGDTPGDCRIAQVASSFVTSTDTSTAATLGGNGLTFATTAAQEFPLSTTWGNIDSTIISATPSFLHLGASPSFSLLGVDANKLRLVSLDMLDSTGTTAPLAENVFLLKGVYGVDTTGDGVIDSWKSPSDTGWTSSDLLAGTREAVAKIDQIRALRIALVVRSTQRHSPGVSGPTSLTLFSSLGTALTVTRSLSTSEQAFEYQVQEWTLPLRNLNYVNRD